jgi:hypothetical protein
MHTLPLDHFTFSWLSWLSLPIEQLILILDPVY